MVIAEREIAPQTQKRLYTEDEYLALEERAAEKSVYVNGEIRLVPGGTDYHGALAMNLGSAFIVALRGRGCLVMSSDAKVRAARQIYYPDLSATCGPRQFFSGNRTVITNPLLVAEAASHSTKIQGPGRKAPQLYCYRAAGRLPPRESERGARRAFLARGTRALGLHDS